MILYLFSLVLIVTASVSTDNCPDTCVCGTQPDVLHASVVCRSLNITDRLPENTETLTFTNATIEFDELLNELRDVEKLPYFSRLILTALVLPNISNVSVSGLDRLRYLEISHCKLENDITFNLTSLQALDLSENEFKVIKEFRTLPALEVLNLSGNALGEIKPDAFSTLNVLKCLDLSRNNLTVLEDRVLVPLITLQHLNLSNNKLEVLNEACFSSLLYLQQLDVSWNRLARVAPGSLQLPSLARLLLAGNPKLGGSREPGLFVGTGRRLQTVDASRTGLKQVPAALTHSIRTLRLAGNSIPAISCGDLDSYPLLQLLDFTSNEIDEIEEDAMGRLDSLTILYLTDNKLRVIPHSLPEKLRVLHLEHNKIERIQQSDMIGMAQLEVLLLTGNQIKTVHEAAFSPLTSLTSLDLSHNPVISLPTGSLAGPTQLRVLRLTGLSVMSPAKEMEFPLPNPEHLITLDLSSSPGMARQLLADTATLAAARELQELNLAESGLNFVRSDLLHFLPQLRALQLHDNPLNCTGMQWLAEWMRRQDEPEFRRVVCAFPPELWGTLLVDLQSIEPETTTQIVNHPTTQITHNNNNTKHKNNATTPFDIPPTSERVSITTNPPVIAANKTTAKWKDNKITSETSTVHNFKLDDRGYPTKPMNILAEAQKINSVLKKSDDEDVTDLFMKKMPAGEPKNQDENVTSAVMSMYSGETRAVRNFTHPGMLILAASVLAAAGILAMLTARITRRRNRASSTHEDIEVSSLPSVTELW